MTDVILTKAATGVLSTAMTIWNGNRGRAADDRRSQRRASAEALFTALEDLQLAVQAASRTSDPVALAGVIGRTYRACRRAEQLQPRGWRHLRSSVRDSVGGALGGAAWTDYRTICEHEPVEYDYKWAEYAADYLEMVRGKVSAWQTEYSERQANRIILPTYNTWLLDTDRWAPAYAQPLRTRR